MKEQADFSERQEDLRRQVVDAREARHWTQKDLAEAAREFSTKGTMSVNTVGNFERKKQFPQPDKLRAIMRALDLEPDNGNDVVPDPPDVDEEHVVEPFDTCPTCKRIAWPLAYEVAFDVVAIYLRDLPNDAARLAYLRKITAPAGL